MTKEYTISNEIRFKLKFYLNDVNLTNNQLFVSIIFPAELFNNINDILIYYKIQCLENLNGFQNIYLLNKEYNEINIKYPIMSIISENELTLKCIINILQIRKNKNISFKYNSNIKFRLKDRNVYKYDFEINEALINQFKTANCNDCFVLDCDFDKIWSLSVIPFQSELNDKGKFKFLLHLCSMPTNIKSMKIDYTIIIKGVGKKKELRIPFITQKEWGYPNDANTLCCEQNIVQYIGFTTRRLQLKDIIHLNKIKFILIIKLKQCTITDDQTIIVS